MTRLVAGASPLLLTTYLIIKSDPIIKGNRDTVDLWKKILAVANASSLSEDTEIAKKPADKRSDKPSTQPGMVVVKDPDTGIFTKFICQSA